jgi:two-component system, OmpR family, KDP operon response regulator KdpE
MSASAAARILVCDDDPQIVRALRVILREAGYEVIASESGEEALDRAAVRPPQAAILDLMLPGIDGVEVCRRLREWSDMPILVLSAADEEAEKVRALGLGADDYVVKPFAPGELLARVQAALRRAGPAGEEPVLRAGELALDLGAHRLTVDGADVHLTPIEFDLLRALMRNRGRLLTHRKLLGEVWGPEYGDATGLLRTHIANLRAKIEGPGRAHSLIRTDSGIGYRFTG